MTVTTPVITIDGPGGSGKGTISKLIAKELGWHYLDSGALYRLLALAAMNKKIALDAAESLGKLALELDVRFDGNNIYLYKQEVSKFIATEDIGNAASKVAAIPSVREGLVQRQRDFREPPGLVTDGRDMGTVIFPDAQTKIYLEASAEVRGNRRYLQLKQQGFDANLAQIIDKIRERDARDSERVISPLKPADDAHVIQTDDLSIDEVFRQVLAWQ